MLLRIYIDKNYGIFLDDHNIVGIELEKNFACYLFNFPYQKIFDKIPHNIHCLKVSE